MTTWQFCDDASLHCSTHFQGNICSNLSDGVHGLFDQESYEMMATLTRPSDMWKARCQWHVIKYMSVTCSHGKVGGRRLPGYLLGIGLSSTELLTTILMQSHLGLTRNQRTEHITLSNHDFPKNTYFLAQILAFLFEKGPGQLQEACSFLMASCLPQTWNTSLSTTRGCWT